MSRNYECALVYQADIMVAAYEKIAQILCVPVASMTPEEAKEKLIFIAGILSGAEMALDMIHEDNMKN